MLTSRRNRAIGPRTSNFLASNLTWLIGTGISGVSIVVVPTSESAQNLKPGSLGSQNVSLTPSTDYATVLKPGGGSAE